MRDDTRVEESKFQLGPHVSFESGDLPWSYGENRLTALVRDPDSAFLYWEATDDGIAAARSRLGPAGANGWCNLRVYDTTGKVFDGTNANDYFDVRVDRTDREYFLMIRRPNSAMHVEIGIKTDEGYFQPIARSGAAIFPRNDPSPNTVLEWMTVTSDEDPPAAAPYQSRFQGPETELPGRAGAGYVDVWRAAYAPTIGGQNPAPPAPPSSASGVRRLFERSVHIERWWHLDEWRSEWRGGLRFSRRADGTREAFHWHEGPFPAGLFDSERVAIELLGDPPIHLLAEGMEFNVFGPWRVSIRSFETGPERRVLSTWSVRWVRAMTPMIERWGFGLERTIVAGYERAEVTLGASEGSAMLERGASERWRIGASERMWLGASEWLAAGGSETLFLGGSQWAFAGASVFILLGASERMGASEAWRSGGSEAWRAGGASPIGGASPAGGGDDAPARGLERWAGRLEEV
jgi:hypothetical protein